MAEEGGIDMLVAMLGSTHPHLQRQASKALANLGVNANNKERISKAGGVGPLVKLAGSKSPGVAVEAVAALANLAVNGESILHRNRVVAGNAKGESSVFSVSTRSWLLHVFM